jgi:hypothetical protein
MLVRLLDQIARRRHAKRPEPLSAHCQRCGRTYARPAPEHHGALCWWCASMEGPDSDPYLDLGGGD